MRRRRSRGSSGQATLELALVLPVLVWLLLGLVDMARMANAYIMIEQAAREGVRLGITGAADTDVTARARTIAQSLDQTRMTVSVTPAGNRTTGSDITVAVNYSYKVVALMGIIGNQVPLTAQLTGRVE